jgi:fermentation-respiration switch protein FrsA (DUF1100 family)
MQKEKVHFQSEELKVVGNLFRPQNFKGEEISLPAILVAGAMTGVKEQVAGYYAERIAKAGYMTLVLDHRHFGESEGQPRQHEDPAKKMEDFKNAISFLSSLNGINRERIGACGISMGGGYMLQLAAFDRRIKALSIVASGLNLADTLLDMLGKEGCFIVHGRNDKYCYPKFAQQVYEEADEPKEILWLDTSNHIDLYDNEKYVGPAISKIVDWFGKYLGQQVS